MALVILFFIKIRHCIRWISARFPIPVGLPSTVIYYSFVFLCTSFLVACKFRTVFVVLKYPRRPLELTLICLNTAQIATIKHSTEVQNIYFYQPLFSTKHMNSLTPDLQTEHRVIIINVSAILVGPDLCCTYKLCRLFLICKFDI